MFAEVVEMHVRETAREADRLIDRDRVDEGE
jgi:hypothetical protein